ncbi:hypothetical protein GUJ93_ZPchr0013g37884 [Zizania palustris]|uniref:Uncharacterized protein n=1 Tax=Zizania palustris TaxID=103762 RepID=A0A8J6BXS7_ZIZPA|nr:hypothetical protein GUJ93_ZPchr0013g37884 [Zizania palustris]
MSRRRGAFRLEIVSPVLSSSSSPQPQVFDLLIRTYTQSRKPLEAFRPILDHRLTVFPSPPPLPTPSSPSSPAPDGPI